ncbi:MAG TPA: hypothetical protein VFX63_16350, partial [Pyrinomonadaceae bacterium]|nr:hypothetical protein [Pyrinomonadaceae bacterium]
MMMLDRDDSPWYPTMPLFRSRKEGKWAAVIDQVHSPALDRFTLIESLSIPIRDLLKSGFEGFEIVP